MEDPMVICPECDCRFTVIWCNNGIDRPEYCPMCGAEINYEECVESQDESNA